MMALDVLFQSDIANQLQGILLARYGNTIPNDSEYLNALDAMGAVNGLERRIDENGRWYWKAISENSRKSVEF